MTEIERLRRWQTTTLVTLFLGYSGYYFCRVHFSLATPYLLESFGAQGLDKEHIGIIASIGTGFYFIGKLINGVIGDLAGGRRIFLFGMAASVVATVFFGMSSGFWVFLVVWATNRFVQSMGWGALVKIASRWFPFKRYGTVMAFLSLSFLFGDAFARFALGNILQAGFSWRTMFMAAAATLAVIGAGTFFLLKEDPGSLGLVEPDAHPQNLFADPKNGEPAVKNVSALLLPFLTSSTFWIVAALSFGLTVIREAFAFWTPTYLTEVVGLSKEEAAISSLYFPLFGGFSVIVAGLLTDRVTHGRRGLLMAVFLLLLGGTLVVLSHTDKLAPGSMIPHLLIALVAFFTLGPYSFLAGAISLDLGGKQGSATAAGLVDAVGYVGGMASGWLIGRIAQRSGWTSVFETLAIAAFVTALSAIVYWRQEYTLAKATG